jgi:hypothetical protein
VSVLGALFRWLVEQRYVLANPFAGLKVRGASSTAPLDAGRGFSQAEWRLLRVIADGLESYGWSAPAPQRLRFVLDFAYATGLRASELVGATLGAIETDARQQSWLHLVGKGAKAGKVWVQCCARQHGAVSGAATAVPTAQVRCMHWRCGAGMYRRGSCWQPRTRAGTRCSISASWSLRSCSGGRYSPARRWGCCS